ncbi:MAG: hypothetical protein HOQ24_13780, partial [Mycobacteriaceae bacterium]|nr:hypothetical protein [Mycobacteriaceae bacterium]
MRDDPQETEGGMGIDNGSRSALLQVDKSRLHLVAAADPTGFLGALLQPGQACRAVFLAAEVEAITWDESHWPDLEFGVWCAEPVAAAAPPRR